MSDSPSLIILSPAGIVAQAAWTASPMGAGAFAAVSFDLRLVARTSGVPGVVVDLFTDAALVSQTGRPAGPPAALSFDYDGTNPTTTTGIRVAPGAFIEFEGHQLTRAAIVVPVHLPFGQISASSFISMDRNKEDLSAEFAEYGALFAMVTRCFVAGYVQAHRTKRRIPSDCVLSKREVECLRWAAIGKTDKEISMILNRSHATIRYHIHRAGEKLDSVNRAQTIFKAGQLGYLGASD